MLERQELSRKKTRTVRRAGHGGTVSPRGFRSRGCRGVRGTGPPSTNKKGHWKVLVAFCRIYPIVLFPEMPHSYSELLGRGLSRQ